MDISACRLVSVVHFFFDKESAGGATKSEIMSNQQLANELHKSITKTFKKCKVH